MNKMLLAGLTLIVAITSCTAATNTYKANLAGTNEVPPVTSNGAGNVTAVLDVSSKVLTITGTYRNLSGSVIASGAFVHGPADATANANPLFALTATPTSANGGTLVQKTTITLTAAQVDALRSDMLYINLRTNAYPTGEIRGQITK